MTVPARARRPAARSGAALGRGPVFALCLWAVVSAAPGGAAGQLAEPCEVRCALVLGVAAHAVGTGVMVAWGRHGGGVSSPQRAGLLWGSGFVLAGAAGLALGGNGERQERAVYAAGLGVLGGAVGGWAVASLRSEDDPARRLAATLVGAGIGALAAGAYGAAGYDDGAAVSLPLFSLRWAP